VFGCTVHLLGSVLGHLGYEVGIEVHRGLLVDVSGVWSYTGYGTHKKVTSQVDFTHYASGPVNLAVDLVNTDQRSIGGGDAIGDLTALKAFLDEHSDQWSGVAKTPQRDELTAIRELRVDLRGVFTAKDTAEATARLDAILAADTATARISVHSGEPHLHYEPQDSTMKSWLAVVTAMGVANVLVDHGLERFGSCQSSACEDVYVDTSRNRSRCHCSTQCSTREAVAAYRRRQQD
jgi:predicted RNA-binding Zn ribbon-like protein